MTGKPLFPQYPILLVDDEEQFLLSAEYILNSVGIDNLKTENDSRKVMDAISSERFSVVVLDLYMPHVSGLELLPRITSENPGLPVIILTAVNDLETAVECMKNGAYDYIVKPVHKERLIGDIGKAIEYSEMKAEISLLRGYLLDGGLKQPGIFAPIITCNKSMHRIFQYIEATAGTSLPILITGETGTGKELAARAVHDSGGKKGKFVTLNVAGVDDTLFSDTLFGHVRGAFTGAEKDRKGLIEEAAGGTLFLDEIGDLCPESQVKLLRLLQERSYYPLGSDKLRSTDARIIAATNKNIKELADSGSFRKDLFYRLQAHHINIPPLRDRKEDIPLLVEYLIEKASAELGKIKPSYPGELISLLNNHSFHGNIRELEAMVYDAVSRHKSGVLSTASFRDKIIPDSENTETRDRGDLSVSDDCDGVSFGENLPTLKEADNCLIDEAMKRADGNQTLAARLLGISRNTLASRLKARGK